MAGDGRWDKTMHTYQYQPGDKPLAGYTIKSAAGHGGFGEVYYAVSDAGREVALKAVQGYEQIELRGIRQCMNLKSPHLVTIFDVKHNDKGQPFVLMEYVSGPSLRDLIDESPGGLGEEKTAFFLREIAKGLSYLHDCGIVHRDLKPANIFFEDGYVKIGDYGLSKAINADHHQSQTVTVGTVHYMAPEVGAGKYDRSIDIYALGCVVYEMLTGHVPFKGDTPSEVLYKHLSSQPELDRINEPFREAISRAMVKDPKQRYKSVNEMVETVFGEARMKQSMVGFNAADLSMVAGKVAAKVRAANGPTGDPSGSGGGVAVGSDPGDAPAELHDRIEHVAGVVEKRVNYASRRIDAKLTGHRPGPRRGGVADPLRDPMTAWQRRILAGITLLVVTLGTGLLSGHDRDIALWFAALASLGAVTGLAVSSRYILPGLKGEPGLIRRLATGGMAILFAAVFSYLIAQSEYSRSEVLWTLVALAAPLFLMDWSKQMSPGRAERLSFGSAIMAGLLGWITSWFVDGAGGILAIGIPAAVMLAVQALSPFDPKVTEDWACDEDDEIDEPAPAAPRPNGAVEGQLPPHARRRQAAHRHQPHSQPVNAYSAVVMPVESGRSRLVALLVAVAPFITGIPVFGIQRFYAGKVGTGLLWFFTAGLCGVGQIVDIILIACGAFDDGEGRLISSWAPSGGRRIGRRHVHQTVHGAGPASGSADSGATDSVYRRPVSFLNVMFSMTGSLMMLMGIGIVLLLSLQVPEAISANVFQSGLGAQLDKVFGYDRWPELLQNVGFPFAVGLFITSGVLLMIARRHDGLTHVLRVVLGVAGLLFAAFAGSSVLSHWDAVNQTWAPIAAQLQADQVGPAIETFMNAMEGTAAVAGLLSLAASVVILALPPRRPEPAKPSQPGEGV